MMTYKVWAALAVMVTFGGWNRVLSQQLASVVERGPHHRVIRSDVGIAGSVTEIATGLHFQTDGKWVEAKEEFEVSEEGFVARQGQHKLILAVNINTPGAVDLLMPDGQRLISNPTGLGFFDASTGRAVLVGAVKDCQGVLVAPGVVLFPDAFENVQAALRYTYTRAGFSQDVILYENLDPERFGLQRDSAILDVYTEFLDPVEPVKEPTRVYGLEDQQLGFGAMQIGRGVAYVLNEELESVRVLKSWVEFDGRTFLVESVPYLAIRGLLEKALLQAGRTGTGLDGRTVESRRKLVALDSMKHRSGSRSYRSANAKPIPNRGLVLDYTSINSTLTNYVFSGMVTYFVSGPVSLNGTSTVFQAGAVLKFTNSVSAKLTINTPIVWEGTDYRPVILTSKDDDTVGSQITGSTGSPTNYYGGGLDISTTNSTIHNVRFSYADTAVQFEIGDGELSLRHAQFVDCKHSLVLQENTAVVGNALFNRVKYVAKGLDVVFRGEHLTVSHAEKFVDPHAGGANGSLYLTNSLLVAITNGWGNYDTLTTNQVVWLNSDSGVFQSVGAGNHYLASNTYRDLGTAAIDASLADALRLRTTYAPSTLSDTHATNLTLTPIVARDTDTPDLGYHYAALDYGVNNLAITNAILILTNGVALATYGDTGIWLQEKSQFFSEGSPVTLNQIARYSGVQEQPINWGSGNVSANVALNAYNAGTNYPTAEIRFTQFAVPSASGYHTYLTDTNWILKTLLVRDSAFGGGAVYFGGRTNSTLAIINNRFESVDALCQNAPQVSIYNNSYRSAFLQFVNAGTNNVLAKDNLFDTCQILDLGNAISNGYNAYVNGSDRLMPTNANDVVLTSVTYTNGPLGNHYQVSTNLYDAGSRAADLAGLFHHTVRVSQAKETNSTVDIGFHYVAVDGSGVPLDGDADWIPDYLEDRNGDGSVDPKDSQNLLMWLKADAIVGLTNGAPIATWSDSSGLGNSATQSSSSFRPTFLTSGVNGKPSVRFQASSIQYFTLPNLLNGSTAGELFAVLKVAVEVPSGGRGSWMLGSAGNQRYPHTDGAISDDFGSTTLRALGDPVQRLDQYHLYNSGGKASLWAARLNGVTLYTTVSNTFGFTASPRLGQGVGAFDGEIAEVVIYNRVLTESERSSLGDYFNAKYALVGSAPASPTNLVASGVSTNQISLTWQFALSNATARFKVERKQGAAGTYSEVATVDDGTSLLDTGLASNTEYYYRVRSSNLGGDSAYSDEASATTHATLAAVPLGNLKLWLKADGGVPREGTNSMVLNWLDQSGTANHGTAANSSAKAVFVDNFTNGRPVLRFDGTNDYYNIPPNFFSGMTGAELFAVLRARVDTPSATRAAWLLGGYAGAGDKSNYPLLDGTIRESFGSTSLRVVGNPAVPLDNIHLFGVVGQAGDWAARINGLVQLSSTNNTFGTNGAPRIGLGTQYFDGDIAEILIFNRVMSLEERDSVGIYLNSKYGFVSNPPATPLATVAPLSYTHVFLNWVSASSDVTTFTIERKVGAGGTYSIVAVVPHTPHYYEDSGLDPTLSYFYRVKARNYAGESGYSAEVGTFIDIDGDGINDAAEIVAGTNPAASDSDNDGVSDLLDAFPLDPSRSSIPSSNPGDVTAPTIMLDEPVNATLLP